MNKTPMVVFSKTLLKAEWNEFRIARGDLAEEIARLRSEPGKDIMAHGGATFVQALSRQGLIDEYRLVIRPVALGSGMPLFKDQSTSGRFGPDDPRRNGATVAQASVLSSLSTTERLVWPVDHRWSRGRPRSRSGTFLLVPVDLAPILRIRFGPRQLVRPGRSWHAMATLFLLGDLVCVQLR